MKTARVQVPIDAADLAVLREAARVSGRSLASVAGELLRAAIAPLHPARPVLWRRIDEETQP